MSVSGLLLLAFALWLVFGGHQVTSRSGGGGYSEPPVGRVRRPPPTPAPPRKRG